MDSGSNTFSRFLALSALLHASLGAIGVTMVRLGNADDATTAAVEVSLVEPFFEEPAAAAQVAAAADIPTSASATSSPIDAARATTVTPNFLDEAPVVSPRVDTGPDMNASSEGLMTLTSSSPIANGEGTITDRSNDGTSTGGTAQGGDAVRAWLEKHKRYPRAATQRRIEGEAILELVIESSGVVAASRIVRSSGHAVLDDEVNRIVARAAPFPPNARPNSGTAQYRIAIEFYLEEE